MAPVLVEIPPIRPAEPDEIQVIDDVDQLVTASGPGCNDDNPYQ